MKNCLAAVFRCGSRLGTNAETNKPLAQGVRIKTRRGFEWTDRFPLIIEAAERLRAGSFVLDGEGVILRSDGVADFERLRSLGHDREMQLLGFDLLEPCGRP